MEAVHVPAMAVVSAELLGTALGRCLFQFVSYIHDWCQYINECYNLLFLSCDRVESSPCIYCLHRSNVEEDGAWEPSNHWRNNRLSNEWRSMKFSSIY